VKKATKIKQPAADFPIPNNRREALLAVKAVEALQTAIIMQRAQLKDWQRRVRATQRLIDKRLYAVTVYCREHRINAHDFVLRALNLLDPPERKASGKAKT
jgi:hypothetical protein